MHLCGSFTNWLETVPMAPSHPRGARVFAVVCNLPPGYHQYKFIVDGEWRHDENQAFIQDPLGNVNNWLFVKKPGSLNEAGHGATQQQGIPIPQHSPAAGAEEARATRERGDAGGSRRRSQNGEGAGMDWVDSMGQMQIKRDVDGVLKPAVSGMTSAMGVKGVGGAVPDGLGSVKTPAARAPWSFCSGTRVKLIPESNKVVVLDTELPVRRAFHACYEQGITAAPLWDERAQAFVGMLSAGDFIDITQIIGSDLAAPAVSEQELDAHTIAAVRQSKSDEGKPPAPLVSVRPEDSLHLVSLTLMQGRLAMAPVLSFGAAPPRGQTPSGSAQTLEAQNAGDENGGGGSRTRSMEPRSAYSVPQLLHLTNLAEVLACLVRHFRGVPSALPLFAQPIGALPIGTWTHALGGFRGAPDQPGGGGDPSRGAAHRNAISDPGEPRGGGVQGALAPLKTLTPTSSVASAFELMPGCGALPVVDEHGRLVDVYAPRRHPARRQPHLPPRGAERVHRRAGARRGARALGGGAGGGGGGGGGGRGGGCGGGRAGRGAASAAPDETRRRALAARAHVHARRLIARRRGGARAPGRAAAGGGGRGDRRGGGGGESVGRRRVPACVVARRSA